MLNAILWVVVGEIDSGLFGQDAGLTLTYAGNDIDRVQGSHLYCAISPVHPGNSQGVRRIDLNLSIRHEII